MKKLNVPQAILDELKLVFVDTDWIDMPRKLCQAIEIYNMAQIKTAWDVNGCFEKVTIVSYISLLKEKFESGDFIVLVYKKSDSPLSTEKGWVYHDESNTMYEFSIDAELEKLFSGELIIKTELHSLFQGILKRVSGE